MSVERLRPNQKPASIKRVPSRRQSKPTIPVPVAQRSALLGRPLLLQGEDPAAYDKLHAQITAAVGPADFLEEVFVDEFVFRHWEVLRWRRMSWSLVREHRLRPLIEQLRRLLDVDHCKEEIVDSLTELLLETLPEDYTENYIKKLARRYVRGDDEALKELRSFFSDADERVSNIEDHARAEKAEQLARGYHRCEPQAVELVDKFFKSDGYAVDSIVGDQLVRDLDIIERFNHLAAIAETRRDACLREIDRRRAALGAALRHGVQEIEDGEFEEIETAPTKGQNAA